MDLNGLSKRGVSYTKLPANHRRAFCVLNFSHTSYDPRKPRLRACFVQLPIQETFSISSSASSRSFSVIPWLVGSWYLLKTCFIKSRSSCLLPGSILSISRFNSCGQTALPPYLWNMVEGPCCRWGVCWGLCGGAWGLCGGGLDGGVVWNGIKIVFLNLVLRPFRFWFECPHQDSNLD